MTVVPTKSKLAFATMLAVLVVPVTAYATHVFDDVLDSAFYAEPVEWAANNGITTGKTPTQFAPLDPVTRGESVTFLQRYDDNVAQPGIAAAQQAADAAQAAADAAQAAAAAAQASADAATDAAATNESALAAATSEPIVWSFGPAAWAENDAGPPTGLTIASTGAEVAGTGSVNLDIAGPVMVNGTTYQLSSVEFCIRELTGGSFVTQATAFGYNVTDLVIDFDATDHTTVGCHTYEASPEISESDAVLFTLTTSGAGTVMIGSTHATWVAAD